LSILRIALSISRNRCSSRPGEHEAAAPPPYRRQYPAHRLRSVGNQEIIRPVMMTERMKKNIQSRTGGHRDFAVGGWTFNSDQPVPINSEQAAVSQPQCLPVTSMIDKIRQLTDVRRLGLAERNFITPGHTFNIKRSRTESSQLCFQGIGLHCWPYRKWRELYNYEMGSTRVGIFNLIINTLQTLLTLQIGGTKSHSKGRLFKRRNGFHPRVISRSQSQGVSSCGPRSGFDRSAN